MPIKDNLNIWATEVKSISPNEYIIDGYAFDGEFGFGGDDQRFYDGTIFIVSDFGRLEVSGSISLVHVSGRGFIWSFVGDTLPSSPFLITSSDSIIDCQSGEIKLIPTQEAKEIFSRDSQAYYPILSNSFIGILHHLPDHDFLVRFRLVDGPSPSSERLIFSEWEIVAGTATIK